MSFINQVYAKGIGIMNKVILTGRLTHDHEIKVLNNDKTVCEFTIATNRGKDKADFINCIVWNAQAENLVKYQSKGSLIAVLGELRIDVYEVEDTRRYKTYVLVNTIEYLESKKKDNEESNPFEQFGEHVKTDFDLGEQIQIEDDDLPF